MSTTKKKTAPIASSEPDPNDLPPADERGFSTPGLREWAAAHPGVDLAKAVVMSQEKQGYPVR